MSFPLFRLPFVALKEVIKLMDRRGIFSLSLISEKAGRILNACLPKKSLHIFLTIKENNCVIKLQSSDRNFVERFDNLPAVTYQLREIDCRTRFSCQGNIVVCEIPFNVYIIKAILYFFVNTFNTPLVHLCIEGSGVPEYFGLEIIERCKQHNCLKSLYFKYEKASFKAVREILKNCQDDTSLEISTKVRKGFVWNQPPGGLKLDHFSLDNAHWVKLEHFLQCKRITIDDRHRHWAPVYLNEFFKKVMTTECRVENFLIRSNSLRLEDFPEIVAGLSERPIRQNGDKHEVEFGRNDGKKLLVVHAAGFISMDLQE